jgi:thermitase
MSRNGVVVAAIMLIVLVAGGVFWQQQSAKTEKLRLAKVRPSDTATAVEIPDSPYLVIPNELVVQLKDGGSVEAFAQDLTVDGVKVIGWIPGFRIVQVEIVAADREAKKAELESHPLVQSVTYQAVFKSNAKFNDPVFINDKFFDDWNLKAINAEAAWDITRGSPNIVIGIVDEGTLLDHEELRGKIVKPASLFSKDKKSMAGSNQGLTHGTHVAIIAAGIGDNGVGTSGVCPKCRIMPVQVGLKGGGTFSTIVAGIEYAINNGARVINLSMAPVIKESRKRFIDKTKRGSELKKMARSLLERKQMTGDIFSVVESKGVVLVVGAGNNNLPGNFNNFCQNGFTICVGNAQPRKDGSLVTRIDSTYGFVVRVAAPGTWIYSGTGAAGGKGYASFSGTSLAAPHVAGLAGLILSAHPEMKPPEVRAAILASGFGDNKSRNSGTRWFKKLRHAHRDMELWRRAFLRLLGKEEDKLLDGPTHSLLTMMVPPAHNTVWGWPYDTGDGKGTGDKVIGRFIDAKVALDMAASGAYRKRFVQFNASDLKKALRINPNVFKRLHDMLWYEGDFTGTPELGGSFSLVAEPPFERLTVKRDFNPGSTYEEWFSYRSAYTYRHHAKHDGKNYSQGKVELVLSNDRLSITIEKTGKEVVYDPK